MIARRYWQGQDRDSCTLVAVADRKVVWPLVKLLAVVSADAQHEHGSVVAACLCRSLVASSWPPVSWCDDLGWPVTTGYAGVFLLAVVWSGGVQLTRTNAGYFRDANVLQKICKVACKEGRIILESFIILYKVRIGHLGFI